MSDHVPCPACNKPTAPQLLPQAFWYPFWDRSDGACPSCVQQNLLAALQKEGDDVFRPSDGGAWSVDSRGAYAALPTPLRLHADPRVQGRGVTIAFLDSGFYPHADLVQPKNRIRAWVDAGSPDIRSLEFSSEETPR